MQIFLIKSFRRRIIFTNCKCLYIIKKIQELALTRVTGQANCQSIVNKIRLCLLWEIPNRHFHQSCIAGNYKAPFFCVHIRQDSLQWILYYITDPSYAMNAFMITRIPLLWEIQISLRILFFTFILILIDFIHLFILFAVTQFWRSHWLSWNLQKSPNIFFNSLFFYRLCALILCWLGSWTHK